MTEDKPKNMKLKFDVSEDKKKVTMGHINPDGEEVDKIIYTVPEGKTPEEVITHLRQLVKDFWKKHQEDSENEATAKSAKQDFSKFLA